MPQVTAVLDENVRNLVRLVLNGRGPIIRGLAMFNPMKDIEVYVDGIQVAVKSFVYDNGLNEYQLYLGQPVTPSNTVQVVHHMPDPPFTFTPVAPPTTINSGFAVSFGTFGS